MSDNNTCKIISTIVCIAVFITVIMVASAHEVLGYNEVGLKYSTWFKEVENKTYTHGIHYIGLGRDFIRYDIKLNTIEFSKSSDAQLPLISTRTKDGLIVTIEASLQYKVDQTKIYDIYTNFGTAEKEILNRVCLDIIHDTAIGFSAKQIFSERAVIQKTIFTNLKKEVYTRTMHNVEFFQLRSVSLPDQFEREIQQTEVKGQDIETAKAEQNREKVKFQTMEEVAKLSVNETEEMAAAAAAKLNYEAEAVKSTIMDVVTFQADAFKTMETELQWGPPEFIQYMKMNLIKDYKGSNFVMQLDVSKPKKTT